VGGGENWTLLRALVGQTTAAKKKKKTSGQWGTLVDENRTQLLSDYQIKYRSRSPQDQREGRNVTERGKDVARKGNELPHSFLGIGARLPKMKRKPWEKTQKARERKKSILTL